MAQECVIVRQTFLTIPCPFPQAGWYNVIDIEPYLGLIQRTLGHPTHDVDRLFAGLY